MKKLVLIFLLVLSNSSLATTTQMPEKAQAEAYARIERLHSNWKARSESYKSACETMGSYRLLPLYFLGLDLEFPSRPLYAKNIFHCVWSEALFQIVMFDSYGVLENHYRYIHSPYREPNTNGETTNDDISKYFKKHLAKLEEVLGSPSDILGLKSKDDEKIPSIAEVFYLDYVTSRRLGLMHWLSNAGENHKRTSEEVLSLSATHEVVSNTIGISIAYKVSNSDNFTKFALSPFFKYMPRVLNGASDADKKSVKEALISEIILGFLAEHAGESPTVLEDATTLELGNLISRYDVFRVINEMKENDLLERSFDRFLFYITSNTSWYASVSSDLDQIKKTLGIEF